MAIKHPSWVKLCNLSALNSTALLAIVVSNIKHGVTFHGSRHLPCLAVVKTKHFIIAGDHNLKIFHVEVSKYLPSVSNLRKILMFTKRAGVLSDGYNLTRKCRRCLATQTQGIGVRARDSAHARCVVFLLYNRQENSCLKKNFFFTRS